MPSSTPIRPVISGQGKTSLHLQRICHPIVKITAMNTAPNLVLVGPMGAGKTSIGKRLAERFGLQFVDADREVEAHTGASVSTIFDCEGEAGFRERERAALTALLNGTDTLIATGGGAVLDDGNRALMRTRGFVVHLHVGVEEQLRRLARDRTRPLLQRDDREDALRALAGIREPLYTDVADLRFDTHGHAPGEAAIKLAQLLAQCWQRGANAPAFDAARSEFHPAAETAADTSRRPP